MKNNENTNPMDVATVAIVFILVWLPIILAVGSGVLNILMTIGYFLGLTDGGLFAKPPK